MPDRSGAIVADVVEGSAADEGGIRARDVILSIDGAAVMDVDDLRYKVASTPPGGELAIGVWREGEPVSLTVTLGELPEEFQLRDRDQATPQKPHGVAASTREIPRLGATLRTLTTAEATHSGLEGEEGVLVVDLERGGPAADRGIVKGDVIQEISYRGDRARSPDERRIRTIADLESRLSQVDDGAPVLLLVRRRQGTLFVGVQTRGR